MVQKPKIQYVGQFYVYGSEARALELENQEKKPWKPLVMEKIEKIEKIYVDPVALVAIAVAVFMLIAMAVGVQQLQTDWEEYRQMQERVHTLRERNHEKVEDFRETYTLSEIREKATSMGMIPKDEAQHMQVKITVPELQQERSFREELVWFIKGLFA